MLINKYTRIQTCLFFYVSSHDIPSTVPCKNILEIFVVVVVSGDMTIPHSGFLFSTLQDCFCGPAIGGLPHILIYLVLVMKSANR